MTASGRTVGPRPELIAEMKTDAGQSFYMYQPGQFMEVFGAALKQEASGTALKEIASLPPIPESSWLGMSDAYELARIAERSDMLRQRRAVIRRKLAHPAVTGEARNGLMGDLRRVSLGLEVLQRQEAMLRADPGARQGLEHGPGAAILRGESPYVHTFETDYIVNAAEWAALEAIDVPEDPFRD